MRRDLPNQDLPIYGVAEAARYLRIPTQTLKYWVAGEERARPLIKLAQTEPPTLSFMNLLECHILVAMRKEYHLRLRKVRSAIDTLEEKFQSPRPLLDKILHTDNIDIYVKEMGHLISVSKYGQYAIEELIQVLRRIEKDPSGLLKFFPYVMRRASDEPKFIMISPSVGFGKPVIAGTGISTAVIASRFEARESIADLAKEYDCTIREVEEAVRWEQARPIAA